MDSTFYRDIAETSIDGLWVFDLDGGTRYANPAVAAMFGVPLEEFMELTVFDTLDVDGRADFARHLEDLRAGRANQEPVEVFFVRQDGSALWTLVSEQILRDHDGAVLGVLHRLTDNDERRRRMDELAESRRELAEAHSIARLGSWRLDADSGVVTCSDSLREIYGLGDESQLTLSCWLDAVHEQDRADVEARVRTALREGSGFEFLARLEGPDGWIWTRGRGVAQSDAGGRVVGLSGTHQDVTAQVRTERALERQVARNALAQAVATACNDARTLADALGELRSVIRERDDWAEARAFVPGDREGEVRQLAAHTYDQSAAADHDLARSVMLSREATWGPSGRELAFPLQVGGRVHAVLVLTATTTPEQPDESLTAAREAGALLARVVEREHAEQELAAARDAALHASQAKSEFLAVMSHEIRTPLNGVIGLNDLMLKTSLERRQRQLSRGIRDAGRSLLRLVNDVLDLSKIEAGHLELEAVDFEVREVCDQTVELMGDAARRQGVELAVACDPDVPEMLSGDPTRLGQVLANLVSNAIKFTEEGHVLVKVSSGWAGRRVRLRVDVTDTGVGIAPDALERVFDDFSQADLSTTRKHGGTGLGLSISRRIVEAFGGELTVASILGEGSTFSFTAMLEVPRGSRTCPDDDVARASLSGGRVLVVSGAEQRARLLEDQLALWRTRVEHVADPEEAGKALERAHEEEDPYEAVVVDVAVAESLEPGRTAELLALAEGPRVFLVLTSRPDHAVVWAVRQPTIRVLTKPVTSAALRGALLEVDEQAAPVSATTATLVRTDRPRVLVVEDNAVNQMVATGMLESLGYETELAEDGVEAVERFDPDRHDAVLMDVQMPRMDGYAATRALREQHAGGRRTPVLAMTAAAIDGERERCLAAGMDDFLAKPVEVNQLGAVLARWVPVGPPGLAEPPPVGTGGAEVAAAPVAPPEPAPEPEPEPEPEPQRVPEPQPRADDPTRTVLDSSRLDALREMGPRAESYIARAVDSFITGIGPQLDDVRTALAVADQDALRQSAHKLAGSALNLGLTEVGVAARAVELREEPQCSDEAYGPMLAALEDAVERALPVLETYREQRRAHLSA